METRALRKHLRTAAFVSLFTPALLFAQTGAPGTAGSAGGDSTGGTGTNTTNRSTTSTTGSMGHKAVSSGDKKFMTHAAEGGLAEVELGQLAAQKASNPQVKEFGERMTRDHGATNDELKQIASAKGVALPMQPDTTHRRAMKALKGKSGADFDRAYMKHMVDDHQKDVKEFERQSQKASDPDLKAFAEKNLGPLREHLQQAKDTAAAVKGRARSGTHTSTRS